MTDYLEALKFYCKELGINPLVTLVLCEDSEVAGSCEQCDDGSFTIYLLTEDCEDNHTPLAVLAHELVHVRQYLEGTLVDIPDGMCLWKGKVYLDPSVYPYEQLYYNAPWEQQAFALQNRLHQNYLRSIGQCIQKS